LALAWYDAAVAEVVEVEDEPALVPDTLAAVEVAGVELDELLPLDEEEELPAFLASAS
jgi:hypothetical protein